MMKLLKRPKISDFEKTSTKIKIKFFLLNYARGFLKIIKKAAATGASAPFLSLYIVYLLTSTAIYSGVQKSHKKCQKPKKNYFFLFPLDSFFIF